MPSSITLPKINVFSFYFPQKNSIFANMDNDGKTDDLYYDDNNVELVKEIDVNDTD